MIQFRPYQHDCINAFYNYYDAGNGGHGLIVVPTAGGKSLIIGGLATQICRRWPGQRIIVLSHVRELIQQNHDKILACWPDVNAGIYSAALRRREHDKDIVTATVQSIYDKGELLGHRDLCFIDEAHLMQFGNLGMYGRLINTLLKRNPAIKLCGFTATDYRIDGGRLTEGEGSIFNDVIIEISILQLLEEGYLTPPITKASLVQADLDGIKKTGGDFNIKQMAARFDQRTFINAALDADMPFLKDRRSIALFCGTLENAAHVADGMLARGIVCEVIDGKMDADQREDKLKRFRSGALRALASVGVITTGTDIPNMDAVVLFRATASPGLYQQIIGRGFRVMYPDGFPLDTAADRRASIAAGQKPNFIVLDHGGNIYRHGPITHVEKPKKREKGAREPAAKAKVRICEICRTVHPLDVRICLVCGHEMITERDATANLEIEASNADIMGSPFQRGERAEWFLVERIHYGAHTKKDTGEKSLIVTYYCGILQFNEYVRLDLASGRTWWNQRATSSTSLKGTPKKIEWAVDYAEYLEKPKRIQVFKKGDFYNVIRHEFNVTTRKSAASPAN